MDCHCRSHFSSQQPTLSLLCREALGKVENKAKYHMSSACVGHLVLPREFVPMYSSSVATGGSCVSHPGGRVRNPWSGVVILKSNWGNVWLLSAQITAPAIQLQALSLHLQWLSQSFVPSCVLASAEQLLHLSLLPMGTTTWGHSSIPLGPIPAWAWFLEAEGCPLHVGLGKLCSTAVLG